MASLVIGAIAAYAAPAGYAALAFSVGSAVGNALFGPKLPTLEGPRITDNKVTSSSYGEMLPILYGSARTAGKLMWSLPIAETRHESRSGGKGGGGQKVVSYTYSQTFAIAVCQAPAAGITGIRRIWANGELIYNAGDAVDPATLYASNQNASGLAIHIGDSAQTADATIQAAVGAANCPAYRGTAYVVFQNMQLEKYGNRMPSLEFEVINVGSGEWPALLATPDAVSLTPDSLVFDNGIIYAGDTTGNATSHDEALIDVDGNLIQAVRRYTDSGLSNGSHYQPCRNWRGLYVYSAGSAWLNPVAGGSTAILAMPTWAKNKIETGWMVRFSNCLIGVGAVTATSDIRMIRWPLGAGEKPGDYYDFDLSLLAWIGAGTNTAYMFGDTINGYAYILVRPATGNAFLYQYDTDGNQIDYWDVGSISSATTSHFAIKDAVLITFPSSGSGVIRRLDSGHTSTSLGTHSKTSAYYCAPGLDGIYWAPDKIYSLSSLLTQAGAGLDDLVSDLCEQVGMAAADIDVTALASDTVPGYMVPRRMTARAAIEPLQAAYFFDAAEVDGQLVFVKRGGAVAVTIPEDDLAAHAQGGAMPDQALITRTQEMELPVEVTVSYIDQAAAYQTGTQNSRRLTTQSQATVDLSLPITLTAAKAKEIADVVLFNAWTARNRFKFATTRKYTAYVPTDVVQVVKGGVTHTVRLTGKNEAGGIIQWDGVSEAVANYTQSAPAVGPSAPSDSIAIAGPTLLKLLDIPILRDQDDDPGFYVAACGYLSGWPGAQLYKSIDAGSTWDAAGDGILNAAAIGFANGALANFTGGNIFDENSTVSVTLVSGTLSSTTELAVLNGANVALLGDEIIQFKNATLTSGSTYTLSGLLRGRRGTEWAMSTHATGDDFVVLSTTTTYRLDAQSSEIGLAREYKGVSFGGFLDDAAAQEFTNTAVGLECLSPVQIGGGRDASNNLTINWIRRTRIGGEWRDYVDASMGEDAESYEVDIYSSSAYTTLKRTLSGLSSATASYTAAQQTTDFGSTQATVYCKVYQLSATVGRGFAGTAAV